MVNIYLNNEPQVPFLTIPKNEVWRLSILPFRWIRYVMFAICGAPGDISSTPDGLPVNYDSILLEDDANLYYTPLEDCHFVDHEALHDKITTSSDKTACQHGFRQKIVDRDGLCIVTGMRAGACEAAHLIPRSKGDKYINKLIQDRSLHYESPPSISDINAVENGVLLRRDLHWQIGMGEVAFLKTPNYGLQPIDIPRHCQHLSHGTDYHITLHQLKRPSDYDELGLVALGPVHRCIANSGGAHTDVQFWGSDSSLPLPPSIILDYLYGVAAYKLWRSDPLSVHDVMSTYHKVQYTDIPSLSHQSPTGGSLDLNYVPTPSPEDEMSQAMDELNLVLMCINGITPQELADQREKQLEEEEWIAQETSQGKVMEWMRHGNET